jgi:SNF2 family DNA or RNA helicase
VEAFQHSAEPTIFLISLKAGGKGLNLTRATYVYHMDPWWNPAVENQASDRAHRIGQTEQVTITRLIMKHTIEEKMMALKEQKTQLYKAILEDGAGGGGAGLTREDFDFLLG